MLFLFFSLCVTAMSSAEVWSSKTITVLQRVVIIFRKQDSMDDRNSAHDLGLFPLSLHLLHIGTGPLTALMIIILPEI